MSRRLRPPAGGATAALFALSLLGAPGPLAAQEWRDVAQSRALRGEGALSVHVQYGAGNIALRPADPGLLYRMQLRYDAEKFLPLARYGSGELEVGIEGLRNRDNLEIRGRPEGRLDVELSKEVELDLRLELGAVRSDLELGGLRLKGVDLRTGASETVVRVSGTNPIDADQVTIQVGAADFSLEGLGNLNARSIEVQAGVGDVRIDLSGEWRQDASMTVEMGLGSLELDLPDGLGVEIEQDSFLTAIDAEGLERRGGRYVTPGFERAARHVRIQIQAAFGKIRVIQSH